MESIRVIVRTTRAPIKSFTFEAEDRPCSWTVRLLKQKLVSKFMPDASPHQIRIVHAGHILEDDHNISEIVKNVECRDAVVLYLINLDLVSDIQKRSADHPEKDVDRRSSHVAPAISETTVQNEGFNAVMCSDNHGVSNDQPILSDEHSVRPVNASDSSDSTCSRDEQSKQAKNVPFDAENFYQNYLTILQRLHTDTANAMVNLHCAHNVLFGITSSFADSYPVYAIHRFCRIVPNATFTMGGRLNPPVSSDPGERVAAINANQAAVPQRNDGDHVEAQGNVEMIREIVVNRLRNQNAIANISMILKLSILLCILYMYEGTYRLLAVITIVFVVYIAQRFGLADRWFEERNQRRVPEQHRSLDPAVSASEQSRDDSNINDGQPNDRNRRQRRMFNLDFTSMIRMIMNFVLSLFFSIVPIEENAFADAE